MWQTVSCQSSLASSVNARSSLARPRRSSSVIPAIRSGSFGRRVAARFAHCRFHHAYILILIQIVDVEVFPHVRPFRPPSRTTQAFDAKFEVHRPDAWIFGHLHRWASAVVEARGFAGPHRACRRDGDLCACRLTELETRHPASGPGAHPGAWTRTDSPDRPLSVDREPSCEPIRGGGASFPADERRADGDGLGTPARPAFPRHGGWVSRSVSCVTRLSDGQSRIRSGQKPGHPCHGPGGGVETCRRL